MLYEVITHCLHMGVLLVGEKLVLHNQLVAEKLFRPVALLAGVPGRTQSMDGGLYGAAVGIKGDSKELPRP